MTSDAAPETPAGASAALRTVIVGDDGRQGGRAAVALARSLAPAADLVLAHAYPRAERARHGGLVRYGEAVRRDAEQRLAATRDEAALGAARLLAVADTSPARALHELAEREHADLVAVGSSHRGPVGRTLLGDVGRDLLHGAPCAVAVAPRGWTARPIRVIGVAYDGSPEAWAALRLAAGLAREHDARLRATYVVESSLLPSLAGFAFDVQELFDELRAEAQGVLDRAVAALDVPVEATAVVGIAAEQLDHLADEVDLLVCGSRGWGAVRRVVLGSTSDRLIRHAPCPVLVVPRPAEAAGVPGEEAAAAASRSGAASSA